MGQDFAPEAVNALVVAAAVVAAEAGSNGCTVLGLRITTVGMAGGFALSTGVSTGTTVGTGVAGVPDTCVTGAPDTCVGICTAGVAGVAMGMSTGSCFFFSSEKGDLRIFSITGSAGAVTTAGLAGSKGTAGVVGTTGAAGVAGAPETWVGTTGAPDTCVQAKGAALSTGDWGPHLSRTCRWPLHGNAASSMLKPLLVLHMRKILR